MRPIDADALKDRLQALAYDDWNQGVCTSWADAYREVAEMVEDQTTIEAVPVVHGRWIDNDIDPEAWNFCSVCGEQAIDLFDYCPNCGASMTEGAEDGT